MPVVTDSRSSIATDPLRNYRYQVNINHTTPKGLRLVQLSFMSCSGLNVETAVVAYRTGGMNTTPQKMPGQSEFTPITLSRGLIVNTPHAAAWYNEIFAAIQGTGTGQPRAGYDFRTTVDILLLAHPWSTANVPVKARWKVFNAWPASLAYSDLDAGGNNVEMEQMVLQHEGWTTSLATDAYASEAAAL